MHPHSALSVFSWDSMGRLHQDQERSWPLLSSFLEAPALLCVPEDTFSKLPEVLLPSCVPRCHPPPLLHSSPTLLHFMQV